MSRLTLTLTLLSAPAWWGCDDIKDAIGAPDAGPQEVVFEAPPETRIADLDAEGVAAVCAAFQSAVVRKVPPETRCVTVGLAAMGAPGETSEAEARSACEEAVVTCTQVARVGTGRLPDLPAGPCPFSQVEGDGCEGTLATLKPCLDTLADTAVAQLRQTFTCDLAGTIAVPDVQVEVPDPDGSQACAVFVAGCPEFFGEGGGATDQGPPAGDQGVDGDAGADLGADMGADGGA